MKKSLLFILYIYAGGVISQPFINTQAILEGNNIRSFIPANGVFNSDISSNNWPGLEWPKGSGKYACFTAGLTIGAYINGQLRMASASYSGEYRPGYCSNGQFFTDSRFKHYKVKRGDNHITNPDWLNWGLMVPYGAPYTDVNNNGLYDYFTDIPGVKGTWETIFICLTDADSLRHSPSVGFGGGTKPLYAEVHLTAWCYDTLGYKNIQFFKWDIINKGVQLWDSVIFTIYSDCDLGDATDDYLGCDTSRNMKFTYNADNVDGDGSGMTYGLNPPAWGMMFLNCSGSNAILSNFVNIERSGAPGSFCDKEPSNFFEAYWFMKGIKKDGTPFVNITNNLITKYCYSGDPESLTGWTMYSGRIENCGGSLTGTHTIPVPSGDKKSIMNYMPANRQIVPGVSTVILAAQMVARGNNNKNSVTLLKQLSDSAKGLCQNGFVIGINPISSEIPNRYNLHQNYPNPFNPVTKIKFDLPKSGNVILKIYDAIGREISTLVNEKLNAGVYSVDWDGTNYPSGVYFYQLTSGSYTETRKMVMIK